MVWSSVNYTIIVNPNIEMVKPQRKIFCAKDDVLEVMQYVLQQQQKDF